MRILNHRLSSRPIVQMGLAVPFILCVVHVSAVKAQWKHLIDQNGNLTSVYFIPGAPKIGFFAGGKILRTSDGGFTWEQCSISEHGPGDNEFGMITPWTFAFKDSMTGWVLTGDQASVFKTTDQGATWTLEGQLPYNVGGQLAYNKKRDALFINGPQGFESTDEGMNWTILFGKSGIWSLAPLAFWNDTVGIFPGGYDSESYPAEVQPSEKTTDAGVTWHPILWDSGTFLMVPIVGSRTAFCLTGWGNVLRTDNLWDSNYVIYSFPPQPGPIQYEDYLSGCDRMVGDDSSNLFVHLSSGCYHSSDEGRSWQYLCGMPSIYSPVFESGFYAAGHSVYVVTTTPIEPLPTTSSLWYLNLDSMQYFPTGIALPSGAKGTTVIPGASVTVNFIPETTDPISVDSGTLTFQFDTSVLDLNQIKLPPDWQLADSSESNGILRIHFLASDSLPNPILQLIFNTYLSPESSNPTKVYLDSASLFGHRLNCDCQALSILRPDSISHSAPDSVQITFLLACGDSTILAEMEHQSPFRIASIVPNPASTAIAVTVSGDRGPGSELEFQLFDQLGTCVLTTQGAETVPLQLDVSSLPSGIYFLRISSGGFAVSRSVSIER